MKKILNSILKILVVIGGLVFIAGGFVDSFNPLVPIFGFSVYARILSAIVGVCILLNLKNNKK